MTRLQIFVLLNFLDFYDYWISWLDHLQTRPMVLILLAPEKACYALSFYMTCDPCGHQLALSLGL